MSTTAELLSVEAHPDRRRLADVEIVIPVYNEEVGLEASIRRLHAYLERFPLSWVITIADNASTDQTWAIACRLNGQLEGVRAVHLEQKGRGRALRAAWSASTSPVVAYMDVDLSTDLDALLPLVAPLLSGHSDVAIGTRLAASSRVVRGPKREAISRSYNFLLKAALHSGFSDAQCGFKAVRSDVARVLLPLVEDEGWFFDTELLVLAEHNGLRIHEVPVDWVDDPDSRVNVVNTAKADLQGIWRMLGSIRRGTVAVASGSWGPAPVADMLTPDVGSQLVRFASIGAVSTLLYAVLFLLLVGPLGSFGAAIVALGVCTIANTAANRRLTFALRGRAGRARHYGAGLAVALLPLGLTLATLLALDAAAVTSVGATLVALTAANAVASVARFGLLRTWVFGDRAQASDDRNDGGRDGRVRDGDEREGGVRNDDVRNDGVRFDGVRDVDGREGDGRAHWLSSRFRAVLPRARQLLRYGAVSVIATATSMTVLGGLVWTGLLAAVWANLVATAVGTVPSFELNRRWVWARTGPRSWWAEVGPFCALSFAGLALSTFTVGVASSWANSAGLDPTMRTIAVEAASVLAFGSLWVIQFVLLDRVLFGRRAPRDPAAGGLHRAGSAVMSSAAPSSVESIEPGRQFAS